MSSREVFLPRFSDPRRVVEGFQVAIGAGECAA
jgi:hypothetical protein